MNWKQRLERAEKHNRFTNVDVRLAESFQTCALGERFMIKDTFNDEGSVMKLYGKTAYSLAMTFYEFIEHNDIRLAKKVFDDIEKLHMPQRKMCPYCDAWNNNYRQKCRVCERSIPTSERNCN